MIKYTKRIFCWISLQNRHCFQTVGLMLGVAALLRESILKHKARDFLHYSFFSKIKCRAREERSWPMSHHPCSWYYCEKWDTLQQNTEGKKMRGGWWFLFLLSLFLSRLKHFLNFNLEIEAYLLSLVAFHWPQQQSQLPSNWKKWFLK